MSDRRDINGRDRGIDPRIDFVHLAVDDAGESPLDAVPRHDPNLLTGQLDHHAVRSAIQERGAHTGGLLISGAILHREETSRGIKPLDSRVN